MNCGCGSTYTLTPGDRLYLSSMVKSLQQRVSALEGGGISSDLGVFINTQIQGIIPSWARQPVPPAETDPTVPGWAKQSTKPTYTVVEISGAASKNYVDTEVATHANRVDNPHQVTAAQIGAVVPSDLGSAAYAATTDFATAAQGTKADLALQPSDVDAMAFVADAPVDGKNYTRKNETWVANVYQTVVEYSDTAPADPGVKFWFKTDTGILYTRYGSTWASIDTVTV